jgi:post-segregation antitoxin (ccd killing protein)
VENTIWRVVSGLNQLTVNAELGGTISAPTLKVSSNLDNAIANQLRAIAGEELAKGEAKARAAVDKIVADKVAPLQAKLDGAKGQAAQQLGLDRKQLDDAQKLLEDQLKRYTGGLGGIKLPKL